MSTLPNSPLPNSPLSTLPGAVAAADDSPDGGVAEHRGDPLAEQRAMDRTAAVVDRSHRDVLAVPGADRLSWLHLLLTQHVSELADGSGTESLVLDGNGRVEHHAVVSHVGDTVWLDTEPGRGQPLLAYLESMKFWSDVTPRLATPELAVLSVLGPATAEVLAAAGVSLPADDYGSAPLEGGGLVRRMPWPAEVSADLLVPRADLGAWWQRLVTAGARESGVMAFEALRVAALRPRLGLDTDEKTIPHEVGWIGSAVHLAKGCYRGQETVARVANLGRPPRRMVLLHLDAGDQEFPVAGDPVLLGDRVVGRVGSVVALHHELGGIALALLKRSVPVDAELIAGAGERAVPAAIEPDSMPAEDDHARLDRATQVRTLRR